MNIEKQYVVMPVSILPTRDAKQKTLNIEGNFKLVQ